MSSTRRQRIAQVVSRPQFRFAAVVLIPSVIWYTAFVLIPVLQTIQISTLNYQLLDPSRSKFIGLDNFAQLIANPLFPIAVVNTIVWTVHGTRGHHPHQPAAGAVPGHRGPGSQRLPGVHLPAGRGVAGRDRAHLPDPDGPRGGLLQQGAHERRPATPASGCRHPRPALPVLLGIASWKTIGVFVVILTAGMLNIPTELYDAARVDGAGGWQLFRRITLPMLTNTLALVTVLLTIGSLQEFTLAHGGHPGWPRQRDVPVQHAHLPGSVRERPLRHRGRGCAAPVRGHPGRQHHVAATAPPEVVELGR